MRYFASSCVKVTTEKSTSGSSLGTFSFSRRSVEVGTDHVPKARRGQSDPPFYAIPHAWHIWRAAFLAEPGQTPHITTWVYGCGRLFRCGCVGAVRREGYGGSAGAVVLGHGRDAPLKTAVVCSSSPQHWAQGDGPSGMRMKQHVRGQESSNPRVHSALTRRTQQATLNAEQIDVWDSGRLKGALQVGRRRLFI